MMIIHYQLCKKRNPPLGKNQIDVFDMESIVMQNCTNNLVRTRSGEAAVSGYANLWAMISWIDLLCFGSEICPIKAIQ